MDKWRSKGGLYTRLSGQSGLPACLVSERNRPQEESIWLRCFPAYPATRV
jgi:hypothetical protein